MRAAPDKDMEAEWAWAETISGIASANSDNETVLIISKVGRLAKVKKPLRFVTAVMEVFEIWRSVATARLHGPAIAEVIGKLHCAANDLAKLLFEMNDGVRDVLTIGLHMSHGRDRDAPDLFERGLN